MRRVACKLYRLVKLRLVNPRLQDKHTIRCTSTHRACIHSRLFG